MTWAAVLLGTGFIAVAVLGAFIREIIVVILGIAAFITFGLTLKDAGSERCYLKIAQQVGYCEEGAACAVRFEDDSLGVVWGRVGRGSAVEMCNVNIHKKTFFGVVTQEAREYTKVGAVRHNLILEKGK